MSEGRILVVEDDRDTVEVLRHYFTMEGYLVDVAMRGPEALELSRKKIPDLVILDINLPGMDGYAICSELRATTRTSHIPIIFLTQRDQRSDLIAGLELGADDYVTKPFDLEELKLRVKNAIASHQRQNMTDPRTGLPAARLIEEQLRRLVRSQGWTYIEVGIRYLLPFHAAYGFVATDEVLRFTALLLGEIVDADGTSEDFVGHASGQTFVIITYSPEVPTLLDQVRDRFNKGIITHYNFLDSEQGGIRQSDGSLAPIMKLALGVITPETQSLPFTDIREITEAAAEKRRIDEVTNV